MSNREIVLEYDLADLPSSQHRAGLAGLVLMCGWLADQVQGDIGGVCHIDERTSRRLRLRLDRDGLRALFDQVYGAEIDERPYPRPFKNKPPLRENIRTEIDSKTDKRKQITEYYYPVVVPKGAYLADWEDGGKGPWTKLWRDMLWNILRGKPATRKPFQDRADGKETTDADELFTQLGRGDIVDLPSTYFLGAQAKTAENVRFRDLARYQLLLHLWPFVAQIYVPSEVDNEGKRSFRGYAVAVPDVANLDDFCTELPDTMGERSPEITGYVPAQAVVDLSLESALDFMACLARRLRKRGGNIADLIYGIDVFHMDKVGNNVKLLGTERVDVEIAMVDQYEQLRTTYRDSRFRRQRLLNLVAHHRGRSRHINATGPIYWYTGFERLLATVPWQHTFGSSWFSRDVWHAFTEEKPDPMSTQEPKEGSLEALIHKFIGRYLAARMLSKYGFEWKSMVTEADKKDYNEKRQKVAKDAFFAVRSRTGQDFVDYFAGSLCSESQNLDEGKYVELALALTNQPDRVRTLILMALCARG